MWKSLFGGKKKSSGFDVGGNKELLTIAAPVDGDLDAAFATFVDRFAEWWPRDYTWAGDDLDTIAIEPRMNGRCFERHKDGTETVWGTVLAFDRPNHLVIAWQIDPNRKPVEIEAAASRADIRFTVGDDGKTSILVVHRDFPRHGDGWEDYRNQMAGEKGWPTMLTAFQAYLKND